MSIHCFTASAKVWITNCAHRTKSYASANFDMIDAVLAGVETRTSSPVKITRGDDFQSLNVKGLYPAGESASYAGGILSAGVDGIEVAEALARNMTGR